MNNLKDKYPFSKIVIWGHKLGHPMMSNTFAFIHNEWVRAFKYLGYEVLWLDDSDDVSSIDFSNSLFFTEGQVDNNIPVRKDCKYVLHNCMDLKEKYGSVVENCLNLQVYLNDILDGRELECIDKEQSSYLQKNPDYSRVNNGCDNRTIHQPWATNLLPNEFFSENTISMKYPRTKKIYWVGSIMGGTERNDDKISELATAAKKDGIQFIHAKVTNEQAPRAIAESWVAPALQSTFQVNRGYIPCRVFKNISYGRMTPINSETVNNLFPENQLVYSADTTEMYRLGAEWEKNPNSLGLKVLIEKVREKHTFVNRIENILKVL